MIIDDIDANVAKEIHRLAFLCHISDVFIRDRFPFVTEELTKDDFRLKELAGIWETQAACQRGPLVLL